MTGLDRIAVVGGGVGGVSVIAALRAGGFDGDVALIDEGEFPYDRPPLSKAYLAGDVDLKSIALQPPEWFDDHRVQLMAHSSVGALRPGLGVVELADGRSVRADKVVLATGGHALRPPIRGSDSARVHALRSAHDADRLRTALVPGSRLLIVGAGLVGAEVASTALYLGCQVTIVDPVVAPLAAVVGDEIASWLHGMHTTHGATVLRGVVESFQDSPDGITAVLSGAEPRVFDAVVLAVGMAPATALARDAGLTVDGGIVVDPMQVTSNPAVLAVGDVARPCAGGVLLHRSEHWEAAQHDAQRAAATILDVPPPAAGASWFWTDRYGTHVEVAGNLAGADEFASRGHRGEQPYACFGLRGGRVVGAVAVNDSASVRAARRMIDRGITVSAAELGDPSVDLRRLIKR